MVNAQGVDKSVIQLHIACFDESVSRFIVIPQTLRGGQPDSPVFLSCDVKYGIRVKPAFSKIATSGTSLQVVKEQAIAKRTNP